MYQTCSADSPRSLRSHWKSTENTEERGKASSVRFSGGGLREEPPFCAVFVMVERAGFEPAYACAGRFTVCLASAENRHSHAAVYHRCIVWRLSRSSASLTSRSTSRVRERRWASAEASTRPANSGSVRMFSGAVLGRAPCRGRPPMPVRLFMRAAPLPRQRRERRPSSHRPSGDRKRR